DLPDPQRFGGGFEHLRCVLRARPEWQRQQKNGQRESLPRVLCHDPPPSVFRYASAFARLAARGRRRALLVVPERSAAAGSSTVRSQRPVCERSSAATASGVPVAMISPPP